MLLVSGLIGISGKFPIEEVEANKGAFFNFTAASPDPDTGKVTYYNASMWVPKEETNKWREKLQAGNTFLLQLGYWAMQSYEGGKYPIPKLKIQRYSLKQMAIPYWYKQDKE